LVIRMIDRRHIRPPYYLLDEDRLRNVYLRLDQAFSSLYEKFIIAYSYKANYVPYMCKALHALGAYAEVASRLEYDLACRLIDNTAHIIFNGPVKSYRDIEIALHNHSIVNLDSFYEVEHLRKYCLKNPRKKVAIGVRVNFTLPQDFGLRVKTSRFGFCLENGDLQKAFRRIREIPHVNVVSLQAHFSSRYRNQYIYRDITARLCEIAHQYLNGSVAYIDIGGNFGHAPKEMTDLKFPAFEEYAHAIIGELKKHITHQFKPFLIIEPGISLVGQAYDFVCNVIEVKKIRRKNFVVVDGSVHNIKPTMHQFNLPVKVLDSEGKVKHGRSFTYQVVGHTCMEKDYLLKNLKGPEIRVGDYLVFGNVGAYTIVLNPPFIHPHPPILVKKDKKYSIIRRGETFRDFFATCKF
jgi:diaminopimelate decarboxylase